MPTNSTPTYHVLPLCLTTQKGKSGSSTFNHAYFALKEYRNSMLQIARRNATETPLKDQDSYFYECLDTAAEVDEMLDDITVAMLKAHKAM